MQSTVSVQIVTYNSEEDIQACLEAVQAQSYPLEEIIVIDNASSDQTMSVLQQFKTIRVIVNKDNTGFAGGHNMGIKRTDTDFVLVLNPDVKLHEHYVKNIVGFLNDNPTVGMATGKLYRNIEHQLLDSTGIHMKKNRRAIDRGAGEVDSGQYDGNINIFGVSGAAAIYRRAMIEHISFEGDFYDECFFAYKEDVDVSWRAQILGWRAAFVPNAVAEHSRGWKEEKKRSEISVYIRQKSYINRYFYMYKNDQFLYFLKHLPLILFFECASISYTLLKERELLSSWRFFKQQFTEMQKKRAAILHKKVTTNQVIYSYFKGIW